ncbi:MAG: anthranilate synthase component I family protein, partial [Balneolales bacterium]|nr:anthranilate synthase component I family protein [Balneolales bacterium]
MVPDLLVRIDENGNWHVLIGQLDTTALNTSYDDTIRVQESFLSQKEEYSRAFYRVQESITEGEFYEINLSYPLEFGFKGNPIALYTRMKHTGPVPFGAYLQISDTSICSSSPERFLAKKGTKVSTQPIKGTSPNSSDPKEKDSIKSLNSVKNKAENLMIVDLVRNDLGRIAKTGTVRVRDLFEIQSFETVHQLVSTVECEIGENADPIEVIKACFPMGSMTGAPKIAAMQAIEKLEWYKRGIYSGAIGYIKPNDDFDFNVVIRSAIIQKGKLVYPVGGAITSDSELEDEWQETLVKAKALTQSFK